MGELGFDPTAGLESRTIDLEPGAWLFRQGQACREVFTVRSGVIRLLRPQRDGTTAVMQVARPGDWIAESSLFSDRFHCHAIADTAATIVAVRKQDVLNLLRHDPAKALQMAETFAKRLRHLRMLHEILRLRRADERVLAWLRLHAAGRPPRMKLERTWTSVADELGLTREALYRALARLKRSGAVAIRGDRVCLRSF